MAKITPSQQANLRRILEKNDGSSLFAHLGIKGLYEEKEFKLLYQDFKSRVPIFDNSSILKRTSKMISGANETPQDVYIRPNLLTTDEVTHITNDNGIIAPLTIEENRAFAKAEQGLLDNLRQKQVVGRNCTVFDVYEPTNKIDLNSNDPVPLRYVLQRKSSLFVKETFLPTPKQCDFFNRSRYQHLHSTIDLLKEAGDKIDILTVRPRTLTNISLILAQQERQFTPITKICPNLKGCLLWGESIAPYRKELGHILSGTKVPVHMMEMMFHAPGIVAWQDDPNISRWMHLSDDTGAFYEFIPTSDLSQDGKIHHNATRLQIEEVKIGGEYLLLSSTQSGFLAFNTGCVIKVVSLDPFRIIRLRPATCLNTFNESLGQDIFETLLAEINDALNSYGFFIRDYILAGDESVKRPLYVLEVSKPLANINKEVLQSIANKIHTELELRSGTYRKAYTAILNYPEIVFVGMGTFSTQPDGPLPPHIDQSPKAELAKKVIDRAWEKVQIRAMEVI